MRMKRSLSGIAVLLIATAVVLHSFLMVRDVDAAPDGCFLWSAKKAGLELYLLGSLHLLGPGVTLPAAMTHAYEQCRAVLFETDLDVIDDPETQERFIRMGVYPEGQTLAGHVSPQTYRLVQGEAEEAGLSLVQIDRYRPWLCALVLVQAALKRLGFDPQHGIDRLFFARAVEDGKDIRFLESVNEQLRLMADMPPGQEEAFLKQTLRDLQTIGDMATDMVRAWRTGDVSRFQSLIVETFRGYPEIYERFFASRNEQWVRELESFTDRSQKVLVVVGAGHLVGKESVVELLRKKGFAIHRAMKSTE
jgi:uncharacterized protein YbaP (TraB family)